jgi:hypothetical protein
MDMMIKSILKTITGMEIKTMNKKRKKIMKILIRV